MFLGAQATVNRWQTAYKTLFRGTFIEGVRWLQSMSPYIIPSHRLSVVCIFVCFEYSSHSLHSDASRTRLVYAFQTDLKGRIPQKLIDTTLPSIQITFFKNLRKAIGERLKEKTGKTCSL